MLRQPLRSGRDFRCCMRIRNECNDNPLNVLMCGLSRDPLQAGPGNPVKNCQIRRSRQFVPSYRSIKYDNSFGLRFLCIAFVLLLAMFATCGCKGKGEPPASETPPVTERETKTTTAKETVAPRQIDSDRESAIPNTPPRITRFDVEPMSPARGETIKAIVETYDKDGDDVSVRYEWSRNDVPLAWASSTLTLSDGFQRGDTISIKVTPDDGKVRGTPLVMNVRIRNAVPVLRAAPGAFKFNGSIYTDRFEASDPDNDRLMFSLKDAPTGMSIDPAKGIVRWSVPSAFDGRAQYTVAVNDGHGGEATVTVDVDIETRKERAKP